jgi:ribosomal protein S5
MAVDFREAQKRNLKNSKAKRGKRFAFRFFVLVGLENGLWGGGIQPRKNNG